MCCSLVTRLYKQPSSLADLASWTKLTQNGMLQDVHQGTVVSDANHSPSQTASSFVAQLIQLNAPLETKVGTELSIDICTACARCKVTALLQKIDRRSGKVLEESPASLKAGEVGFCRMEALEPVRLTHLHIHMCK
jgi:elongation factor 1-alpha